LKYRAEIDGLRALAVIPVILFHAGFETFSGGFVGVDVFFVISGYLITSMLIEDLEHGRFSVRGFYERRARRILPALFFMVAVCGLFAWFWMTPDQLDRFSLSVAALSLFGSNLLFWQESDYFDAAAEEKPLLHTWSLAVEEQYYLLFPLFLLVTWRFGKTQLFWLIALLCAVSFLHSERSWAIDPVGNFYLAPTRAWELFAGSVTALFVSQRGVVANDVLGLFGVLAVLMSIVHFDRSTPFPSAYTLVPVLGVVLVLRYAGEASFVARLLSTRLLVGLGLISYSAYLWHQPLFAFARIRSVEEPDACLMAMLSMLALGVAVLSWRFIERPFRNTSFLAQYQVFLYGGMGLVVLAVLGATGHFMKGVESRLDRRLQGDIGHAAFHQYIDKRYHDCTPPGIADAALTWRGFRRCKQSKQGRPEVVLLGDSHAEHLFIGVAEALADKNVVFYILNGAPYVSSPLFTNIFDELLFNQQQQQILIAMNFHSRVGGNDRGLYREMTETVMTLKRAGKQVVLVGDIPAYGSDPAACVYSSEGGADRRCHLSLDMANRQKALYSGILQQIGRELEVRYVDLYEPLCNSLDCGMTKEGTVLYRDRNHLNIPGSQLVGTYLARILSPQSLTSRPSGCERETPCE